MDRFFWVNDGSSVLDDGSNAVVTASNSDGNSDSSARKVKERDVELAFAVVSSDNSQQSYKVKEDEKKEPPTNEEETETNNNKNQHELILAVHGRGCNEFGSFIINGEYTVSTTSKSSSNDNDNKSHNKLICKKYYSDSNQDKEALVPKNKHHYQESDDDNAPSKKQNIESKEDANVKSSYESLTPPPKSSKSKQPSIITPEPRDRECNAKWTPSENRKTSRITQARKAGKNNTVTSDEDKALFDERRKEDRERQRKCTMNGTSQMSKIMQARKAEHCGEFASVEEKELLEEFRKKSRETMRKRPSQISKIMQVRKAEHYGEFVSVKEKELLEEFRKKGRETMRKRQSKFVEIRTSINNNQSVSPEEWLCFKKFKDKCNAYQRNNNKRNRERFELLKGEEQISLNKEDRFFIAKYNCILLGNRRRIRRRNSFMSMLKGIAIYNVNSGNTTMKMLGVSQLQWVLHVLAKFNDHYVKFYANVAALFIHHPDAEIDEWIPAHAWDFTTVWHELACWHFLNSQMLLKKDNNIKRHYYDEEYKSRLLEDVKNWYLANKSVGKSIVDAMHKTAL